MSPLNLGVVRLEYLDRKVTHVAEKAPSCQTWKSTEKTSKTVIVRFCNARSHTAITRSIRRTQFVNFSSSLDDGFNDHCPVISFILLAYSRVRVVSSIHTSPYRPFSRGSWRTEICLAESSQAAFRTHASAQFAPRRNNGAPRLWRRPEKKSSIRPRPFSPFFAVASSCVFPFGRRLSGRLSQLSRISLPQSRGNFEGEWRNMNEGSHWCARKFTESRAIGPRAIRAITIGQHATAFLSSFCTTWVPISSYFLAFGIIQADTFVYGFWQIFWSIFQFKFLWYFNWRIGEKFRRARSSGTLCKRRHWMESLFAVNTLDGATPPKIFT